MVRAINEVALANNESAQGAQNIAEKSSDVLVKVGNVKELMKLTEQSSERLVEAVARFKV